MPSYVPRQLTPEAEAQAQQDAAMQIMQQQAAEQDFIAKQQQEQRRSQQAQEAAAKEAERAQKEQVAAAKRAGAITQTDLQGRETIATHEDGAPRFEAGFQGEPLVQDGKASVKYRDARGQNYDVPLDAVRAEKDPSGQTFYAFDIPGQDGKPQTFRQPEGTKPLFRVDKTTGERLVDVLDPATGSVQTARAGLDAMAANEAAIAKRREAFQLKQNEISGQAEEIRLLRDAADTKFAPVREKFTAAQEAYDKLTKSKERYEYRPDPSDKTKQALFQVTSSELGEIANPLTLPDQIAKAQAWLEQKKRVEADFAAAKAEHDPAKAELQSMQEKRDALAIALYKEKQRANAEIRKMEEAAKAGAKVYEQDWQKRVKSIANDPRAQSVAAVADLEDAGDPLAPDVERVTRPQSAAALNVALEAGLVSMHSPLAGLRTETTPGMQEAAAKADFTQTLTQGITAGKTATVTDANAARDLAVESLGMQPDGVEIEAMPEGHYQLARNGETFATLDPRNNRMTLLESPKLLSEKAAEIINNASSDGVPVYMLGTGQPFTASEVRSLIQEGVNAATSAKTDAEAAANLAKAGLAPADIREKVLSGKLSVQDAKMLNEKFNGVKQVNTTAPAVQAGFGQWMTENPVMAAKFKNGDRQQKAEVANAYMDGLAAKANAGVVVDRATLNQRRTELLASIDDRSGLGKAADYAGGAIKNGLASLAGIGYWMLRAPDRAVRLVGGTDDEGTNLVWNQSRDLVQRIANENAPWNKDSGPMGAALGELEAWANSADSVDDLPDDLAEKMAEAAFTNYHGFTQDTAAATNTSKDTFNPKKDPVLRGMLEQYLATGNGASLQSLYQMLKSNGQERQTQIQLQKYIERPRTATPADAAARAKLLGIDLDANRATAVLGIAKQLEGVQDEKQYAELLKSAAKAMGLEKPSQAALALSEIARMETTDPESWTGSFRGASVAGIEEAGIEVVSDVALAALSSTLVGAPEAVALKAAQVAAKQGFGAALRNAVKRTITHNLDNFANRSSTFATIRQAIGKGRAALGNDLRQMGEDFTALGIQKPGFGQPLTLGQKASNLAVATGKAAAAGAPLEALEEGATAFLSNDPSAANIGESMLQGALGVGGIVPAFTGVSALRNAYRQRGMAKQWEAQKLAYIGKVNEVMAKVPGFAPLTVADFDAWQGFTDRPEQQAAREELRSAIADFEALREEHDLAAAGNSTLPVTPELLIAKARVEQANADMEMLASDAFMAMQDIRGIPEAERPLFTGAAKAAAGVTDYTEAEAAALIKQSGSNAVIFQQAQTLPGDVQGPPAMRNIAAPEVTTAAPGVYRLPQGVRLTVPQPLLDMIAERAPNAGRIMGGKIAAAQPATSATGQPGAQPQPQTNTTNGQKENDQGRQGQGRQTLLTPADQQAAGGQVSPADTQAATEFATQAPGMKSPPKVAKKRSKLLGTLKAKGVVVRVVNTTAEAEAILGKKVTKGRKGVTQNVNGIPHVVLIGDQAENAMIDTLDHEAIHGLSLAFAAENPELHAAAMLAVDPASPEFDAALDEFMRREYNGYDKLSQRQKFEEALRAIIEGRWKGRTSAKSKGFKKFLQAFLAYVQGLMAGNPNAALTQIVANIEAAMQEGASPAQAANVPAQDTAKPLPAKAIEKVTREAIARVAAKSPRIKKMLVEKPRGLKTRDANGKIINSITGGFQYENGEIQYHVPTIVAQLEKIGVTDPATVGKRVEKLIDEEIRHAANFEAALRLFAQKQATEPMLIGLTFATWRDAWYGDIWNNHFTPAMRQAVQEAYGNSLPQEDWKRAFEGLRMLDQLRATGSITEAVLQALDAILESLREFLDLVTAGGKQVVEAEIEAIRAVLAEYGYEQGAVKPAKAKQSPETAPEAKTGSPASDGAADGAAEPAHIWKGTRNGLPAYILRRTPGGEYAVQIGKDQTIMPEANAAKMAGLTKAQIRALPDDPEPQKATSRPDLTNPTVKEGDWIMDSQGSMGPVIGFDNGVPVMGMEDENGGNTDPQTAVGGWKMGQSPVAADQAPKQAPMPEAEANKLRDALRQLRRWKENSEYGKGYEATIDNYQRGTWTLQDTPPPADTLQAIENETAKARQFWIVQNMQYIERQNAELAQTLAQDAKVMDVVRNPNNDAQNLRIYLRDVISQNLVRNLRERIRGGDSKFGMFYDFVQDRLKIASNGTVYDEASRQYLDQMAARLKTPVSNDTAPAQTQAPAESPSKPAEPSREQWQKTYAKFKRALAKAVKAKDYAEIIRQADAFQKHYETEGNGPFPDQWSDWERHKADAEMQLARQGNNPNPLVVPVLKPITPPRPAASEDADYLKAQEDTRAALGGLFSAPARRSIPQLEVPEERFDAVKTAAKSIIAAKIRTPEAFARFMDDTFPGGKARPYSEAIWDVMGVWDKSLRGTHNWSRIYGDIDQPLPDVQEPEAETQPDNLPFYKRANELLAYIGTLQAGNNTDAMMEKIAASDAVTRGIEAASNGDYDSARSEVQTASRVLLRRWSNVSDLLDDLADMLPKAAVDAVPLSAKEQDEAAELAITQKARAIVVDGGTPQEVFQRLKELYDSQPKLTAKTSTSKINQAYSTPAPMAYAVSRMGDVASGQIVAEPSAGNGMLLIERQPGQTILANELDPARRQRLAEQGIEATGQDASIWTPAQAPDRVIANPPFGQVMEEGGQNRIFKTPMGETTSIDHAIVLQSLATMAPGGRAVFIIGGPPPTVRTPEARMAYYRKGKAGKFFGHLYGNHRVIDHFTISGDLYEKQGAGWPLDVLLIQASSTVQRSPNTLPGLKAPRIISSWEELSNELNRTDNERIALNQLTEAEMRDRVDSVAGELAGLSGNLRPTAGDVATTDTVRGTGVGQNNAGTGGEDQAGVRDSSGAGQRAPTQGGDAVRSTGRPDNAVRDAQAGNPAAVESGGGSLRPGSVTEQPASDFQASFPAISGVNPAGLLAPVNLIGPMREALTRLREQVGGDIVGFVREKLGYPAGTDISKFFFGDQIDALAQAIYTAENGGALVIGDQTGTGKGRIAAGLMKYAVKSGLVPVFVTKDQGLYDAMLDDLQDIQAPEIVPLVSNQKIDEDSLKTKLKDLGAERGKEAFQEIIDNGDLPGATNTIFVTYDQIKTDDAPGLTPRERARHKRDMEAPPGSWRMAALRAVAPRAMFILDESHLAGGQSTTGWRFGELLRVAKHAYYSSATFAKRPDNMGIYFRTNLGRVGGDINGLIGLMQAGGVPAMQISSSMLAQDGQYMRRERSFDGVTFRTHVNQDTYERDKALADNYTEGLRAIIQVQERMVQAAEIVNRILSSFGKSANIPQGNRARLESANFSAKLHNLVRQYLLAIKSNSAAQLAVKAIKDGVAASDGTVKRHKVIVTVENTMESIIDELQISGLPLNFNGVLQMYLNQMRRIKVSGGAYGREAKYFEIQDTPNPAFADMDDRQLQRLMVIQAVNPETGEAAFEVNQDAANEMIRRAMMGVFNEAKAIIDDINLADMPLSPIDAMRQAVEREGIKTGEMTGRETGIDKRGQPYQRSSAEIKGKLKAKDEFNNGDLDFLVINKTGSTGVSMHASEKFKDKRPRLMMVVQANLDINEFMQTIGRIHRAGQVELPSYINLQTALPAENRPAAILGRKMAMLNANTTSNADSELSQKEVADIFNQYGDVVVHGYLAKNPGLVRLVAQSWEKLIDTNGNLKPLQDFQSEEEGGGNGYLSRSVTGHLAILPVDEQEIFWEAVTADYRALISYLDEIGKNDLRASVMDLKAETVDSQEFTAGREGGSVFERPSMIELVNAEMGRRPMEAQDAITTANEARKNATARQDAFFEASNAFIDAEDARKATVQRNWDERRAEWRSGQQEQRDTIATALGQIGSFGTYEREDGSQGYAFIEDVLLSDDPKKINTPSAQFAIVRVNDSQDRLKLPLSQLAQFFNPVSVSDFNRERVAREGWERSWNFGSQQAIITGNLIAALGELQAREQRGRVISYTKRDGSQAMGILLSQKAADEIRQNRESQMPVQNADEMLTLVSQGYTIKNPAETARFAGSDGQFFLYVPLARATGGKFWRDPGLLRITGEFEQNSSDTFVATMDADAAKRAFDYLRDVQGERFTRPIVAGQNLASAPARRLGRGLADMMPQRQPGSAMMPRIAQAYRAVASGSSSRFVPIRAVFQRMKAAHPEVTPDSFMAEITAADARGDIMVEAPERPETIQAAGPFVVRNALGVPSTNMTVVDRGGDTLASAPASPNSPNTPTQQAIYEIRQQLQSADAGRSEYPVPAQRLRQQAKSLLQWAVRQGKTIAPADFERATTRHDRLGGGEEHDVWLSSTGERVIKLTKPGSFGIQQDLTRYLDTIEYSNRVFGDDIVLEGIIPIKGWPHILISQPFYRGDMAEPDAITGYFTGKGATNEGSLTAFRMPDGALVYDAKPRNVLKLADGIIQPIDVQVALASAPARVTPAQDAEYLAAVQRGDMATAQRMVDEAAQAAGYDVGPLYHSTAGQFDVFDDSREGIHLGTEDQAHERYNQFGRKRGLPRMLALYAAIKNPLRLPDLGTWENFQTVFNYLSMQDVITPAEADAAWSEFQWDDKRGFAKIKEVLRSKGYDGIIYANEQEGEGDSYIAFNASQVKEAWRFDPYGNKLPVTDDAGNVIPLSQRFNEQSDSILYSAPAPKPSPKDAQVREILESLHPVQRNVLEDNWAGLTIEETAKKRNMSPYMAGYALRQAEGRLRILLDKASAIKPTVQVENGIVKAASGMPELALSGIAAVAGVDQRRMRPEEVTHAEMNDFAARLFSVNPEQAERLVTRWMDSGGSDYRTTGMDAGIGAIVDQAQALNAGQMLMTAAAKLLVTRMAMKGGDSVRLARLIDAYRNTGTEQSRALGMRRDPFDTPEERAAMYLQEALLTPPDSIKAELRKNPANRERILAAWAARADKIKAELLAEGIDIDATLRQLAKEQELAEATIPEPVKPVLARAPKKTRQLVKAILEGRPLQEALDASGLTPEQANRAYEAFRREISAAANAAAVEAKDEMLRSAPAPVDYAANLGLPAIDFTKADLKKSAVENEKTRKLKEQRERKKEGGELDLRNRKSVSKAVRKTLERKSNAFEKMSEFWRASILSGPQTHVVNIVSGATFGLYEATFKKLATGAQADILRMFGLKPDAASLADAPAMLAAAWGAIKQAGLDFITEWQDESNVFDAYAMALTDSQGNSFKEAYNPALKGKLGTIMRGISFRLMGAADAFVKSFFTRVEVVAQARQIARNENLTGDALRNRINELVGTLGSEAWERALGQAKRITFQNEEVRSGDGVQKLESPLMAGSRAIDAIDGIAHLIARTKKGDFGKMLKGLAHFTFPFVDTPTNIFKMGVTMSPVGGLLGLVDALRSLQRRKQGNVEEANRIYNAARALDDLTNQIVAWGFILGLSQLVKPGDDDEELPYITGTIPWRSTSPGEREIAYRTAPPQSIRIGGQWYSYKRLDPFASALAFTVDAIKELQSGKPIDEAWGQIGLGMLRNMQDKTFLQGVSDLVNAATDPERFGTKWATNIAIGFVPNLIRQPIRTGDDVFRENDLPNDMGFVEALGRRVGFGVYPKGWKGGILPDTPIAPMPAFDLWGREAAKNTGTGQPGTDWLLRLFSPVDMKDADNVDPLDRSLHRYNMTHAEPFGVAAPSREIERTLGGKVHKVSLSDAEYTDFVRKAGQAARSAIGSTYDGRDLTEADVKTIKGIIEKVHDTFRNDAFAKAVQARGGLNVLANTPK